MRERGKKGGEGRKETNKFVPEVMCGNVGLSTI